MEKCITLNELIKELQKYQEKYGNEEIKSISINQTTNASNLKTETYYNFNFDYAPLGIGNKISINKHQE